MHLMSDLLCGNLLILNDISQQYNAPRGEATKGMLAVNHKPYRSWRQIYHICVYLLIRIHIQAFYYCVRGG